MKIVVPGATVHKKKNGKKEKPKCTIARLTVNNFFVFSAVKKFK